MKEDDETEDKRLMEKVFKTRKKKAEGISRRRVGVMNLYQKKKERSSEKD